MTEAIPAYDPAAAWAQIEAQHAARARLADEALPANKAALFDALAAAGITSVLVTFDGSGDSGQIEDVDATRNGEAVELPAVEIEIATPVWDGSGLDRRAQPLAEAIETLAYAFLEDTHDGWEINEGAYGAFTFDVAERSVQLDYNERVGTSEYHGHSW